MQALDHRLASEKAGGVGLVEGAQALVGVVRRSRGAVRAQQPLADLVAQGGGLGLGLDLQIAGQQAAAGLVLGQGGAAPAVQGHQGHHLAVGRLREGIERQPAAGCLDPVAVAVVLQVELSQGAQALDRLPVERFALHGDPLLKAAGAAHVEPGQKVATVEVEGAGQPFRGAASISLSRCRWPITAAISACRIAVSSQQLVPGRGHAVAGRWPGEGQVALQVGEHGAQLERACFRARSSDSRSASASRDWGRPVQARSIRSAASLAGSRRARLPVALHGDAA